MAQSAIDLGIVILRKASKLFTQLIKHVSSFSAAQVSGLVRFQVSKDPLKHSKTR